MLKRNIPPAVNVGSRFEKAGMWGSYWTIEAIFNPMGLPSHVRLVEAATGRKMTVAASVLTDSSRFTLLDSP